MAIWKTALQKADTNRISTITRTQLEDFVESSHPDKPKWYIDNGSSDSPYYEGGKALEGDVYFRNDNPKSVNDMADYLSVLIGEAKNDFAAKNGYKNKDVYCRYEIKMSFEDYFFIDGKLIGSAKWSISATVSLWGKDKVASKDLGKIVAERPGEAGMNDKQKDLIK